MITLNLVQGSPEWHAHRACHHNASDAPAMLGVSPYKTRSELVREKATGIRPEIDAATQRIFDDGHRFEELARPLAEEIVGEELFPCVGVADDSNLSASFDGLTMLGNVAFEHKTLNDTLRAAMQVGCTGADLPEHYRAQMEQQLMVSGADKVLFMASKWNGDRLAEKRECWYMPDVALRAKIVAGWDQFEEDCRNFDPGAEAATKPAQTGASPETLPVLSVRAEGKVLASNLDAYRDHAMQVLGSINRDLQTDQDFADAEQVVKWCKSVESKLSAAKDSVLGQMATVDEVCRTIDDLSAETRRVRLDLDKLVKAEKERRKSDIVNAAVESVQEHCASINASLGQHALQSDQHRWMRDISAAIKGLKTLSSITDAADTAAANLKIEASQQADRIRAAVAVLDEFADHASLFADRVQLCATKSPEDLRNLAKARVTEHEERERQRIEAERERIRAEEQERAEQIAKEQARKMRNAAPITAPPPRDPTPVEVAATGAVEKAKATDDRLIKLGDINAAIAPISITAQGLHDLANINPVNSGRSKLYRVSDVEKAIIAMQRILPRSIDAIRNAAKEAA